MVKVLYVAEERAAVQVAAELAGLRPSGYVAAAALAMAQRVQKPGPDEAGGSGRDGGAEGGRCRCRRRRTGSC